jgi:hypothetical protein
MPQIRWMLRWVFVRGPAEFWRLAERDSWWLLTGVLVSGAAGAGVGALVGVLTGISTDDGAFYGGMIGVGSALVWLVLAMVVLGVLWARGITPAEAAAGKRPEGDEVRRPTAGWRRRGQPLVPLSAVGFLALMAVVFGAIGAFAWEDARPQDELTAVVDGSVVVVHGPGLLDRGSGSVTIRYVVQGADYSIEVDADIGDRVLRQGDVVPVEYVVARPAEGRSTEAVESARSDTVFWLSSAGVCGLLAVASGIGYLVGRRRRPN